ncbi:recombinase family protein [Pseudoduganella sp. DS3]|uniref:Recombinase family protein n=2 Tax=Pseudoduganella guangdongensis TaxID=2692179 RepID=A0A6N9HLK3_9BURK|nr:recombinase family protein [Pseudoduganella guangdongensis]
MSSIPQDHSIQHQMDRLNNYADENGFEIVRMYADAGKSGLCINGRDGLQDLISDVQSGTAGFDTILVYDVSRWGRFQDIDESAHYEFICRRAGVQVIYCAEHFIDDGSPMYSLMKGMKRIMAAEYSRELGAKVLHAQCRFSQMGYKQGGRPGYGLRRIPVSKDGEIKQALEFGERKPVATDRVALHLGPPEEVEIVRRIYHLYVYKEWTDSRIAKQLCSEGHLTHLGNHWDPVDVRRILINPRYCGELIFNQTTRRLRSKVAANPEEDWVHCKNALEPMVSRELFEAAMSIRRRRAAGPEREKVLAQIREVFQQHGTINAKLCNASPLPKKNTMYRMFGTYMNAFAAAGLPTENTSTGALALRSVRILIDSLIIDVLSLATRAGAKAVRTSVWNVLRLNGRLSVKVSVASYRRCEDGCRRWRVPLTCGAHADFVICGLMDSANREIECYLHLATADISKDSLLLSRKKLSRYKDCCYLTLDEIFGLPESHPN